MGNTLEKFAMVMLVIASLISDPVIAQAEIPKDVLSRIEVVAHPWCILSKDSPEQTRLLGEVVKMSREQREGLLESENGRERGIGIFVTAEQEDLKRLFELKEMLYDESETIPGVVLPDPGGYRPRPQRIGEYVTGLYQFWFGFSVPDTREGFDESRWSLIEDPERLVRPWIIRLHRARQFGLVTSPPENARDQVKKKVGSVKQEIEKLPEDVRWAVVTEALTERSESTFDWLGFYSEQEARDILRSLSGALKEKIRSGTADLEFDPCLYFEDKYTEQGRRLMQAAARLLEEPQP